MTVVCVHFHYCGIHDHLRDIDSDVYTFPGTVEYMTLPAWCTATPPRNGFAMDVATHQGGECFICCPPHTSHTPPFDKHSDIYLCFIMTWWYGPVAKKMNNGLLEKGSNYVNDLPLGPCWWGNASQPYHQPPVVISQSYHQSTTWCGYRPVWWTCYHDLVCPFCNHMGVVASQLHQPPGVGTGQWGEPVTMTWFVPFVITWVLLLHSCISHLVWVQASGVNLLPWPGLSLLQTPGCCYSTVISPAT